MEANRLRAILETAIEMRVAMIELKIGLMIILLGSLLLSVYLTAQPR